MPPAAHSWLRSYGGPVLGLLVVAALLLNLTWKSGEEAPSTAAQDTQQSTRLPDLVTVTPDFSAAREAGGPAQRAVSGQASQPVRLKLSNGVTVPVQAVGTSADGALDVPEDIRVAGWWRGGSRLGDPFGSMLIAAHVDSRTQGLGPYVALLSVEPGARFEVTGRRDLVQTFAVSERRVVARDKLSTVPDIFSPRGAPRLTMVTCAGPYDRARGGYQNLAVVTAKPVGPPAALGAP